MPSRKKSFVWDNFSESERGKKAKCNHCKNIFSFAVGATSNLSRHLKKKHPTIQTSRQQPIQVDENEVDTDEPQSSTNESASSSHPANVPNQPSTQAPTSQNKSSSGTGNPPSNQPKISAFVRTPLSHRRQQALDEQLTKMIVKGYHAFSLVEEDEFRKFVFMLNPSYSLPSRKTVSTNFIPRYHKECKEKVKEELKDLTVALTTDCWTSVSNDSYCALTGYFLSQEMELKSVLIDCSVLLTNHTADNLEEHIKKVAKEWNITNKILAVSSDNAANITAAIRQGQWKHVPCTDHTLNLIVKAAVKENLGPIKEKVKAIVRHFKMSPTAEAKLKQFQIQMNSPLLKLKQSVKTRWNSEYEMFKRILAIKDPVIACLAILDSGLEVPIAAEWTILAKSCEVLQVFDELSTRMASEKKVTLSEVRIMVSGARAHLAEQFNAEDLPQEVKNLIRDITYNLNSRFGSSVAQDLYDECMLLDPRFKKEGFNSNLVYQSTYERVQQKLRTIPVSERQTEPPESTPQNSPSPKKPSVLFKAFDNKVKNLLEQQTAPAAHIVELDKFIKTALLPRRESPLLWWKENCHLYPRLSQLVRRRLCIPATSVPCERIFSKCGLTITQRRNCLKPSKASQLAFLNANW